jgi:RNA polymerase sigma-70 factor (ECF subfamily)
MTSPFPDSTLETPSVPAGAALTAAGLEDEVVGLFEQFRDRLLRYLLALGLDAHDGEEIVQEVFLALFQHLQGGKSRHNLRSWIFRVAHNLALKQRTRNRRRVQNRVEAGAAAAQAHIDPSPNPEEQLLSKDRRQRLRAVLDVLPEKDRWCLYLRAEGLRYREIGAVLGISLGAVSLIMGRSLARLGRADR